MPFSFRDLFGGKKKKAQRPPHLRLQEKGAASAASRPAT